MSIATNSNRNMQIHFFAILCALISQYAAANEFVPNVRKSHLEGSNGDYDCSPNGFYRFGDSETLMLIFNDNSQISFDNGEHWQSIDVFKEGLSFLDMDEFHIGRAFAINKSEKIYVTEDQGRSWRQINLPKEVEESGSCFPTSHPFDRNPLLLECYVTNEDSYESERTSDTFRFEGHIVYASSDAGESFRRIVAPVDWFGATPNLEYSSTGCEFAPSSAESTFDRNGIYCIHQEVGKFSDIKEWPSNLYSINVGEGTLKQTKPLQPVSYNVNAFFYTSDFGKSAKVFDEFKGFSVEQMWISPSKILVVTSDGSKAGHTPPRLWISTGGPFKPANLPEGVVLSPYFSGHLLEWDQKRILLYADVKGNDGNADSGCLLISDPSGFNFSFIDFVVEPETENVELSKIKDLKGTVWGVFSFEKEVGRGILKDGHKITFDKEISWFGRFLKTLKEKIFGKASYPNEDAHTFTEYREYPITKVSFDGGRTWNNPRVVDPSGKHKYLFNCDIDDVEHCSFWDTSTYSLEPQIEPTAGMLTRIGVVGESALLFGEQEMAFISRDGGASWEVALEYPAHIAFLDFGNIIVAVPEDDSGLYTKFLFSLDQGINWKEYHFSKTIYAEDVSIHNWGLKAVIIFAISSGKNTDYMFYSIDFSEAYNGRACGEEDLETWYSSNGNCIDGVKYIFNRRKPEAQCLMRKTFGNLTLNEEMCD